MGLITLFLSLLALKQFIHKKEHLKVHCWLGYLTLIFAVIHGIAASMQIGQFFSSQVLSGIVCIILIFILILSFYFQKKWPVLWKKLHKIVAILLLPTIVFHLFTLH